MPVGLARSVVDMAGTGWQARHADTG